MFADDEFLLFHRFVDRKTEIALISSAAVLALVIVFVAVVHFKFGVCGRKSAVPEPSNGIKFSELSHQILRGTNPLCKVFNATGTAEGEGLAGVEPYYFFAWVEFLGLQMTWIMYEFA